MTVLCARSVALNRNLAVTRDRRGSDLRQFFLYLNTEYKKDIRTSTLATWRVETVKLRYKASGAVDPSSSGAHEIRVWSATLALIHSDPLNDILKEAYRRSEGTFLNFLLPGFETPPRRWLLWGFLRCCPMPVDSHDKPSFLVVTFLHL